MNTYPEILKILQNIKKTNEQILPHPKRLVAMLKDLTSNNPEYTAIVRWIGISLLEFDALTKLEMDIKNKQDFARRNLLSAMINEGASEAIANEVVSLLAMLAGFDDKHGKSREITIMREKATGRVYAYDEENNERFTMEDLEAIANNNDPDAQCAMGDFYNSDFSETNFDKAFHWYNKAANLNNPKAQWNMGSFYGLGVAVNKDLDKSRYWFEKSAKQGYVEAMFYLSQLLLAMGGDLNKKEAIEWLNQAAKKGHEEAGQQLLRINTSARK